MDDSTIIENLGGTAAVAKLCRVKMPSVSIWKKTGIPESRRMFLQAVRPDAFRAELANVPPASDSSDAEPAAAGVS